MAQIISIQKLSQNKFVFFLLTIGLMCVNLLRVSLIRYSPLVEFIYALEKRKVIKLIINVRDFDYGSVEKKILVHCCECEFHVTNLKPGGITMGKVLLVDYNTNQRTLCEKMLREDGYNVVSVGTAKEALLNVDVWSPDIIVLDVLLPDMDRFQLNGRSFNKGHKIVVHTAYQAFANSLMMCDVDAYILESSDLTMLKDMIRELLEQSNSLYFQRYSNN